MMRTLVVACLLAGACHAKADRAAPSTAALLVHNALRGDLTLVEDLAGTPRLRVLPCASIGKWALPAALRDGQLVALDTERRQLAVIKLSGVRQARCLAGEDLVTKRVPLHGGGVPYRGKLVGERLFVSYFSENRLEVYHWPDLTWERDVRFDAAENLGLSDMDADGQTLLVTATGYVCFERHCPQGRFHASHLYFLDTRGPLTPPFREARPKNLNTLSVAARPGYVVSAGELEGGYGSLQRLRPDGTLGAEIKLPKGSGPETIHLLHDGALLVHQMAGEYLFLVDPQNDRLRAILRFDGKAFVSVATDVGELPDRSSAELQDVIVDPRDPDRLFIVDMKGDRLVRARRKSGEWTLAVERVDSLANEAFRSATQWMAWLP
jgi:hypothetical protein